MITVLRIVDYNKNYIPVNKVHSTLLQYKFSSKSQKIKKKKF